MIDPKYYEDIQVAMSQFSDLGTKFIVGGRGGVFLESEDAMFSFLTREEFKNDLSSTLLRA
jgi:hypothetical protein